MGFTDFLSSVFNAFTPPGLKDNPSCTKCLNCKARIKTLPSGRQIRVFTCPYTGEYDNLANVLPSVNPSDPSTYHKYSEAYKNNINYIYESMSDSVEQQGGNSLLKSNDFLPITTYNELKYATRNLYACNCFKPCLYMDNSGSYYPIDNEMILNTSYPEEYFSNLSAEDQQALIDLTK